MIKEVCDICELTHPKHRCKCCSQEFVVCNSCKEDPNWKSTTSSHRWDGHKW